ncbi:hypothetical protein fugu_008062 [Takifugu bimaculatus]|uniref:Prominin-1-A n=1 Tax=Takifugu bimaculatus TaxID=433685 RepID=A0A4Z2B0F8_9TELE|nr:hypothetical protein fugu_008062 [Takifugu bimaculatus]
MVTVEAALRSTAADFWILNHREEQTASGLPLTFISSSYDTGLSEPCCGPGGSSCCSAGGPLAASSRRTRGVRSRLRASRTPADSGPLRRWNLWTSALSPRRFTDTHAYYEPGPIGLLFHVVHAFLYVVQPNPFPKDMIVKVIQQNMGGIKIEEWRKPENVVLLLQWVYYEVGFLICTTVGVLLLVVMPIIGSVFLRVSVLRELRRRDAPETEEERRLPKRVLHRLAHRHVGPNHHVNGPLAPSAGRSCVGVVIAYAANHNMSLHVKSTRRLINTNIRDLKTFANNTPSQIDYLMGQYITAKNKVLSELDNIGPLLGGRIHSQLEKEVVPSLDGALRMAGAMRETKEALENVSSALEVLQEATGRLKASLSDERASLSNTLSDPACTNGAVSHTCSSVRATLAQLGANADFSRLADVNQALANVNVILGTDLSNIVQKESRVCWIKLEQKSTASPRCSQWKVLWQTSPLSSICSRKRWSPTIHQLDQMDFYSGVGFSFIFAWVLMGVVTTLFVVGGNVEKLLCEPLANRQLFKIIDTPFLVHPAKKNFLPGMLFQNPNIDLTLGSMYSDCYENSGLYHALQLETMFNINSFLNRTVYNKDLAKVFESVQVDLQGISLLEQAGRDALINFANSGIGYIDYDSYLAELNKGVTLVDLLTFSADLEAQADQLPRGALENALKGHASSIRQIHRDQVLPMEREMVITDLHRAKTVPDIHTNTAQD